MPPVRSTAHYPLTMPPGDASDPDRFRLPSRVDTLAALVRGQVQLVVVAALAVTWLVPVADLRLEDDERAEPVRLSLTALVGRFGDLREGLPDQAHPFSRGWGVWLVIVGTLLVLAATVALAWFVVTAIDARATLPRRLVVASAVTLLAATALLTAGLGWYPGFADDVLGDVALGTAWGLWLPAAAAVAVLLGHPRLLDLAGLDDPR